MSLSEHASGDRSIPTMPGHEEFCPVFENAPTVETVLGVQFQPLRGFRCGHYGWFWRDYLSGKGFEGISDETLLPTYVEAFGDPKLQLNRTDNSDALGVRMKLRKPGRSRTVQIQPDKLYLSWNRSTTESPRFAIVKPELTSLFDDLKDFAGKANLGKVVPNLWEVQYVNQIPPGPLWTEPRDWHKVLPTLFPAVDPSIDGVKFATYTGEWFFEIEPQKGRVHVRVAKMVMNQSTTPTLYLSLIARGEIGERGSPDMVTGLELGHAACVRLFFALTSSQAHALWGLKHDTTTSSNGPAMGVGPR